MTRNEAIEIVKDFISLHDTNHPVMVALKILIPEFKTEDEKAKEYKELLLKDLCARLPYKVKVHCKWNLFQGARCRENGELVSINIYSDSIHFKRTSGRITEIPFNRIDGVVLPYLRPMSSITEEELDKYEELEWAGDIESLSIPLLDWLNKNMFDYRGLIEKGLALEAPEGMYKFN